VGSIFWVKRGSFWTFVTKLALFLIPNWNQTAKFGDVPGNITKARTKLPAKLVGGLGVKYVITKLYQQKIRGLKISN
jgi:hypothetical protein